MCVYVCVCVCVCVFPRMCVFSCSHACQHRTASYLCVPRVQRPPRPGEQDESVVPALVQEVQQHVLVLLGSDEAVPLVRLQTQSAEGLLSQEVHPLVRHRTHLQRLGGHTDAAANLRHGCLERKRE